MNEIGMSLLAVGLGHYAIGLLRDAVLEGLARFPEDARLMDQARDLGVSPEENR